jgi:hypothetical protein
MTTASAAENLSLLLTPFGQRFVGYIRRADEGR